MKKNNCTIVWCRQFSHGGGILMLRGYLLGNKTLSLLMIFFFTGSDYWMVHQVQKCCGSGILQWACCLFLLELD
jgi:hypothetical protein